MRKRSKEGDPRWGIIQTRPRPAWPAWQDSVPLAPTAYPVLLGIRQQIPMVDAALRRLVRLAGGVKVVCQDPALQPALEEFLSQVPVNGINHGLSSFLDGHLDSMLTYGNGVGEMVTDTQGRQILGLFNADPACLRVKEDSDPLEPDFLVQQGLEFCPVERKELLLYSAHDPAPGQVVGRSVLEGLPAISDTLSVIFRSIHSNFERVGNVRYAVTYQPAAEDQPYAGERARQIAREWSRGMESAAHGQVQDLVAVGNISIKAIGSDNQILDTEIPVRQLLEQIIAKLGVPPFLLGLSWSTTERMAQQQTTILASELSYYRRLLEPVIQKICRTWMGLSGVYSPVTLEWEAVDLQDQLQEAQADYYRARANQITLQEGNP